MNVETFNSILYGTKIPSISQDFSYWIKGNKNKFRIQEKRIEKKNVKRKKKLKDRMRIENQAALVLEVLSSSPQKRMEE